MSTKFTPLHSFYILTRHFDQLAITPKWNTPYCNTRFIAADRRKITGIHAAVNQKNAVLIRGLKQKKSVQLCNIHHPDEDCPWAKRPDIRTQTYTYVACSRLRNSRFGEIENKAGTRKKREETGERKTANALFFPDHVLIFSGALHSRVIPTIWNRLTHMVQRQSHLG